LLVIFLATQHDYFKLTNSLCLKKKFYVVWKGRQTGIFETWEECKAQVHEFPQAKYKSFKTLSEAKEAFDVVEASIERAEVEERVKLIEDPIIESIAVDGAWNTVTGDVEYRGIYMKTGEEIFKQGPFKNGTNNIVEFLAIVHALAYCKKKDLKLPIYSDSRNAINWVRDKQARTKLERETTNEKLFELIDRALKWLKENEYNNKILKWETRAWGENPADFGRK
jgi:ribonuclease HI